MKFTDAELGVTEIDKLKYDVPCKSAGTRRCALPGQHTSLDHLRIGLAEKAKGKE